MRQLRLPFYGPTFVAPERGVLTLLHAALRVADRALRDEHPALDTASCLDAHAPLVVATARLIAGRCAELTALLDLYDAAVDDVTAIADDSMPF